MPECVDVYWPEDCGAVFWLLVVGIRFKAASDPWCLFLPLCLDEYGGECPEAE
jgi:hypothetical protein